MTQLIGADGRPAQQQQTVNIKPSELDDVRCEQCDNYTFVRVFLMKRMPAMLSPTGKEAFMPMEVFACNACGHVNERFLTGMGQWFKSKDDAAPASDPTMKSSKLPGLHAVAPRPPELPSDE